MLANHRWRQPIISSFAVDTQGVQWVSYWLPKEVWLQEDYFVSFTHFFKVFFNLSLMEGRPLMCRCPQNRSIFDVGLTQLNLAQALSRVHCFRNIICIDSKESKRHSFACYMTSYRRESHKLNSHWLDKQLCNISWKLTQLRFQHHGWNLLRCCNTPPLKSGRLRVNSLQLVSCLLTK